MEMHEEQIEYKDTFFYSHDPFKADRLSRLQRKLALCHWRGLEEEAKSSLPEYHQLVNAIYFNHFDVSDKS